MTSPRRAISTWLLVAAVWTAYTIPEAMQAAAQDAETDPGITFSICLQAMLPGALLLWTPLTVALLAYARRVPLTVGSWPRRVLQLAGVVFAALVYRLVAEWLFNKFNYYAVPAWYEEESVGLFENFLPRLFSRNPKVLLVVSFCYAWAHVQAERENRLRIAELQSRVARARLDALAAQLNPDFLFRTLHAIARRAYVDADSADQMLMKLSSLLRFSLAHRDDAVDVEEEIELAREYLAIESILLDGKLDVQWSVDPHVMGARVPALIVQSLAERVIPRDASGPFALRIALRQEAGTVAIDVADAQPGSTATNDDGPDLADVRARLDGLYGTRWTLVAHTGNVRVTLPLG